MTFIRCRRAYIPPPSCGCTGMAPRWMLPLGQSCKNYMNALKRRHFMIRLEIFCVCPLLALFCLGRGIPYSSLEGGLLFSFGISVEIYHSNRHYPRVVRFWSPALLVTIISIGRGGPILVWNLWESPTHASTLVEILRPEFDLEECYR
jgi:hypothetical protein